MSAWYVQNMFIGCLNLGVHPEWHDVSQWQESVAHGSKQILWR